MERNYRIPIQDFWLLNRVIRKTEPIVKTESIEKCTEKKQQTLF